MNRLEAVIFDCDGVLFDSLAANIAYYNAVLTALGCGPMDAELERVGHQLSSQQLFERVFGDDPQRIREARAVALATDYEPFYAMMQPMADLHATLNQLRRRYRLAMATNRGFTAAEVARRFELAPLFECVVGINDVPRPKPHPDMLLHCLERLGVAASAAVYVGDAPTDHQAAAAAGMHFIGFGEQGPGSTRVAALAELEPQLALMFAA